MSKDKHTVQTGIHVGRVGVYVYAREYWQYYSWQFGVSIDAITVTTVMLILRRKYCLSALANGLYGLKER